MSDFENFGGSNNTSNETDLNYSPEGVQASVDSTPAEQTTEKPGFYNEYGQIASIEDAREVAYAAKNKGMDSATTMEKELKGEIQLTDLQKGNEEMREGLKKKYPYNFESFTFSDGTTIDIEREEALALSYDHAYPTRPGIGIGFRLAFTNDGVYEMWGFNNKQIENFLQQGNDALGNFFNDLKESPYNIINPNFFQKLAEGTDGYRSEFKTRLKELEKIILEKDDRTREEIGSKKLDSQALLDQL